MSTAATELARAGVKNITPFESISMPFSLRDYQVEGLNLTLRYARLGLYFEPRLGKTFVFLLTALYCANYKVKTIILAPPIIHPQLQEEWLRMEGNPGHLKIMPQGPARRKKQHLEWLQDPGSAPSVLVTTKNIFIKDWKVLVRCGYTALTWDECHTGLQKASTQIYAAVDEFSMLKGSRLLLSTGTPIPTSPVNAYPIIRLNNPWAYKNEGEFEYQHVLYKKIKTKNRYGREVLVDVPDQAVGLDVLHKNLYAYAIRKTRLGTLKMKAPDIAIRDLSLTPAHQKLYNRLIRERVLEIGEKLIKATQAAKLRQVAAQLVVSPNNYTDKPIKDNVMLSSIDEIFSEYRDSERFVLVAHYNQSVETLTERYRKHDPCVVYGGQTPQRNQKDAARFKAGKSKLMIMNAAAGGVGLTLGHVCSKMIVVEPIGTYGGFDQAISRIMLVENKEPISVYILRAAGTSWVKAVENMISRSADIRQVNNDAEDLLKELLGEA